MGVIRALRSGTLVEVDERGKASFVTCSWLIQVASGHPEPDFPEDCWKVIECGAKVKAGGHPEDDPLDSTICEAGHGRFAMGSAAWLEQERDEWMAEREMAMNEGGGW